MIEIKLSLPRSLVMASTIGFKLSKIDTGVTNMTQVMKSMMTRNQDFTYDMPSSLYMFSQMISD